MALDTGPRVACAGGMARMLRVQYAGAIYHVMSRSDRRGRI